MRAGLEQESLPSPYSPKSPIQDNPPDANSIQRCSSSGDNCRPFPRGTAPFAPFYLTLVCQEEMRTWAQHQLECLAHGGRALCYQRLMVRGFSGPSLAHPTISKGQVMRKQPYSCGTQGREPRVHCL